MLWELSEEGLSKIFSVSLPLLDERQRRLMVEALGRGGQARVAVAAEMSRNTLTVGSVEFSKVAEGAQNPDRNAQFEYINARAGEHLAEGEPVISTDCKRQEVVGRVIETSRYSPPRILTIVPKESPVAGATNASGLPEPLAPAFCRSMYSPR